MGDAEWEDVGREDIGLEDGPQPENAEGMDPTAGQPQALEAESNLFLLGKEADKAPPGDRTLLGARYCLKAPFFSGEEDVEQFISEFSNMAAISQ